MENIHQIGRNLEILRIGNDFTTYNIIFIKSLQKIMKLEASVGLKYEDLENNPVLRKKLEARADKETENDVGETVGN